MTTQHTTETLTWMDIAIAELESYLLDPTADRTEQAWAAMELREKRIEREALSAAAAGRAR
jgi:hypothetical protein